MLKFMELAVLSLPPKDSKRERNHKTSISNEKKRTVESHESREKQGLGLMSRYVSHHPTQKGIFHLQLIFGDWWCETNPQYLGHQSQPLFNSSRNPLISPAFPRETPSSYRLRRGSGRAVRGAAAGAAAPPGLSEKRRKSKMFRGKTRWLMMINGGLMVIMVIYPLVNVYSLRTWKWL